MLFLTSPLIASPKDYLESLIEKSQKLKLAESKQWQRILMIDGRLFSGSTSIVDDPAFFRSPKGRNDPEDELKYTLLSFFTPAKTRVDNSPYHPQCYHAGRFYWLHKHLEFDFNKMPLVKCEALETYKAFADYDRVSLVFSSYYLNNPASMFGHTLFRFHRRGSGTDDPGLLDDAASFAAFVQTMNPLTYPFQGLMGMFPGRYSMHPYYRKIQEYNNYESRDLWEYELNLDEEQVRLLSLLIFEYGNTYTNYYYLSDNCALVLLVNLEAVHPELELSNQFDLYATPSGTLKAAARAPGLVRNIRFRPSALGRYVQRLKTLSKQEEILLTQVIKRKSMQALTRSTSCNGTCRAKVSDASVEFIDFKERLSGSRSAKEFASLRRELLEFRAGLGSRSLAEQKAWQPTRPDLGHTDASIALLVGPLNGSNSAFELIWKPALHDIGAHAEGYTNQMQIGFMDTSLRYEDDIQKYYLNHFYLLDLLSLPQNYTLINSWAWHFRLGLDGERLCRGPQLLCHRFFVQMGFGKAIHIMPDRLIAFGLIKIDVGFSDESGQDFHAGPVASTGVLFSILDWLKFRSGFDFHRAWGRRNKDRKTVFAELTFYFDHNFELKSRFNSNGEDQEILTGLRWFY